MTSGTPAPHQVQPPSLPEFRCASDRCVRWELDTGWDDGRQAAERHAEPVGGESESHRSGPVTRARGYRAIGGTVVGALLMVALVVAAVVFVAGPARAAAGVSATATLDGRAIAGADAGNPVRLDPKRVAQVVVEVTNGTANPVSVRRVDLAGHVLGLNFYSYSTTVELTVAAGKTEKLTYRLDPAGLDGQATGLIGSDLTLIGADGKPLTAVHTVVDVRGSLASVYGLFGIIIAVLTALAIVDAALTVARHRLSVNRWQRGLRLLAPGLGIGLMIGFTGSVARWWVPGTALWLALAGATAALFFVAGYLSPTPRQSDDLGLDPEDLAAAKELDANAAAAGPNPPYGGTFRDLGAVGIPGGTYPDLDMRAQSDSGATEFVPYHPAGGRGPGEAATQVGAGGAPGAMRVFGGPASGPIPGGYPSGETTRIAGPGIGGGRYPGGGPLASAMQPDTAESATAATDSPGSGSLPGTQAGTGPHATGSVGLPTVSGPGGEGFRYSAAGVDDSTVGYPGGVQRPRSGAGLGETTIGRDPSGGKDNPGPGGQADPGDEPTLRSGPGGPGFRPGGAGR
ncbi:hypothetical protein ACQP1O_08030 [Nocardia sp. CA-151230]|uniref:hypothetical protein n=1 Tax=Nocardia sp. CA-151230 TaxID=3239982 RepID=UPI003D92B1C9